MKSFLTTFISTPKKTLLLAVLFVSVVWVVSQRGGLFVDPIPAKQTSDLFANAEKAEVSPKEDPLPLSAVTVRQQLLPPQQEMSLLKPDPADQSVGKILTFNLFDDVVLTGNVTRTESFDSGRTVTYGELEGIPGDFILASNGDSYAADFFTPTLGHFRIRPQPDGSHAAEQWDPSALPDCNVAHIPEVEEKVSRTVSENRVHTKLHTIIQNSLASDPVQGSIFNGSGQQGGTGDGLSFTEIDVMVVYTANARAALGGPAGMIAVIDVAVARANSVFINSDVGIRLHVVRTEEVNYTEIDTSTDLGNLQNGNGGLSSVATWRDQSGADLVALFTNMSGGRAFLYDGQPNSADFGYSVSGIQGVESTFAHEIGHNLSLRHDRDNDETSNPLYSYSHGWRFTPSGSSEVRTIMAYAPGNHIPYFSNPDVSFMGTATGVPIGEALESNNAQALRNTKAAIAAFRGSPTNEAPSVTLLSPGYSDSILALEDVLLSASASDADGSVAEVRFYRLMSDDDFQFSNKVSTSLGTDAAAPYGITETEAPAGFWTYAVAAIDGSGAYSFDTVSVSIAPHYRKYTYPMPLGKLRMEVTGISLEGKVVGFGHNGNITATDTQAVYLENDVVVELTALPGDTGARATSVDAQGVVYGESVDSSGNLRAVKWESTSATDLSGLLPGFNAESVVGIDEQGRVYLTRVNLNDVSEYRRVENPGSTSTGLNQIVYAVSSTGTFATGIDYDFGVAAWRALRWDGTGTSLDPVGGYVSSWGLDVNRSGAVAGVSSPFLTSWNSSSSEATYWPALSTTPTSLGTFGGTGGVAYGINDFNYIVGSAEDASNSDQAYIWKGSGDLIDLNTVTLNDGSTFRTARVINNQGQIAGTGFSGLDQFLFFLDPLPGIDHHHWLGKNFSPSELENPSLTADDATPAGDGVPNLLKRSAGLEAYSEDTASLPRAETDAQGHLIYIFRRMRVPGDISYEPLATQNLVSGPWDASLFEVSEVINLSNDMEQVTLRSIDPLSDLGEIFIRLKVDR